jgi:hypothetical protein
MPEDKGAQQDTPKGKVVLVGIQNEKNRYEVIKVLAQQLGMTFEETGELIKELPMELIPSIPVEAGEQFAERLRQVGADVEVLPIGKAAGHFCSTHPHRRARAKCKEPGCDKYICEICIRDANNKLYCPECYARYKRRRVLIALSAAAGLLVVLYLWFAYGSVVKRWFNYLYVDTTRVALVFTSRQLTEDAATYFLKMTTTESPGEFKPGDAHTFADIDGWYQREFVRLTAGQINILELDTYGLYEITGEVPKPARGDGFSLQGLKANRVFQRYFKDLIKTNAVKVEAYDYVLFIELTPESGVEQDYMEQLGVINEDVGFVRIPMKGAHSNDYYVMTVAHYVARLLGARPHLDARGFPVFPTGYGDPAQSPRYPQVFAELMGCYVAQDAFEIRRINAMDQAAIGPQTAFEMGWLSRARADKYYAPLGE